MGSRSSFCSIFGALLIVLLSVSGLSAQSFGGAFSSLGDNDEPVNIEAERLEILDKEKVAILTGNVRVIQGTSTVSGKEMRVFYLRGKEREKTRSGIERIEINGGVAIKSDENRATADKAVIDLVENVATLMGNVNLSQGDNIAKACSLWVDLETRNTKLNHACSERVVIVTTPPEEETQ
ncbi:MAG: LptA/OstA family protein [Pseudomonadota bacterium]